MNKGLEQNIPKIIHYCWFGKGKLNELSIKCIESWKKFCPDYEIIEWNEENFDISINAYVKEAYEQKKYAFVSDYVRLYALYNYGGIYMDTDVEVLKSFDSLLKYDGFSGFEDNNGVQTAVMASKKGHDLIGELLSYYADKNFVNERGIPDLTTNVIIITNICKKYGLKLENNTQDIKGIRFFPSEFFCPKSQKTGEIKITDNTYTIHHFYGSWIPYKYKEYMDNEMKLTKKYGVIGSIIGKIQSLPYKVKKNIQEKGFIGFARYGVSRIFKHR